ncbi:DUF4386 family protein [Agromyces sp. NPDC049794]|uniref:DUF4386 family protein n=1 Tax=Agromyces sp. NPDC049794 TaxID=3154362 RepID=UPI0033C42105
MTSSIRSPHIGDTTPAASIPPMPGSHRVHDRLTGLVAAGTATLFTGAFALLGATFDYPDILDREAGEILTRFADAGSGTRVLWYLMLVSSLAFIPLAVLVHRNLRSRGRGSALNDLTAVIGVVAGVLQALGFARWTFAMPYLSDTYVDPATTAATRDAVVVTFEVFHRYLGGALGEHLGFASPPSGRPVSPCCSAAWLESRD